MDQLGSDLSSLRIARDAPSGPSPLRRVAVTLLVLGILGALGLSGWKTLSAQIFKHEVTVTEVAMISPAQASVQVTSTGYVVAQVSSKVGPKISGRLASVLVKEGDVVKAGDLLATIADADQRSAVAAAAARVLVARARVETTRANLAEVSRQLDRMRGLLAGNAVPRAQVEDLETRAKSLDQSVSAARAETAAAQAESETLRVGLKDRAITAPINGTVISKPSAIGEAVSPGSPLCEIADFASILVETDVPEARLGLVKPGSPCEIVLDAYPTRRYRGVTAEIGKRINRAKATAVVKVRFQDAADGVLPDMAARVSFLSEPLKAEALQEKPKKIVSADALVERDGGKAVFVVDEGSVKLLPVSVGASFGSSVELLDGPAAGTRVVSRPPKDLRDGHKIKERDR